MSNSNYLYEGTGDYAGIRLLRPTVYSVGDNKHAEYSAPIYPTHHYFLNGYYLGQGANTFFINQAGGVACRVSLETSVSSQAGSPNVSARIDGANIGGSWNTDVRFLCPTHFFLWEASQTALNNEALYEIVSQRWYYSGATENGNTGPSAFSNYPALVWRNKLGTRPLNYNDNDNYKNSFLTDGQTLPPHMREDTFLPGDSRARGNTLFSNRFVVNNSSLLVPNGWYSKPGQFFYFDPLNGYNGKSNLDFIHSLSSGTYVRWYSNDGVPTLNFGVHSIPHASPYILLELSGAGGGGGGGSRLLRIFDSHLSLAGGGGGGGAYCLAILKLEKNVEYVINGTFSYGASRGLNAALGSGPTDGSNGNATTFRVTEIGSPNLLSVGGGLGGKAAGVDSDGAGGSGGTVVVHPSFANNIHFIINRNGQPGLNRSSAELLTNNSQTIKQRIFPVPSFSINTGYSQLSDSLVQRFSWPDINTRHIVVGLGGLGLGSYSFLSRSPYFSHKELVSYWRRDSTLFGITSPASDSGILTSSRIGCGGSGGIWWGGTTWQQCYGSDGGVGRANLWYSKYGGLWEDKD